MSTFRPPARLYARRRLIDLRPMASAVSTSRPVRWKRVALPVEHGAWGLALEPVVLGLAVAPSMAGLAVGLSALAAFLAHRPFQVRLLDRRRSLRDRRTRAAEALAAFWGAVALGSLALAVRMAGPSCLLPLALAFPFAAVVLVSEVGREGRALANELAGPLAFGAAAAAIATAGGWRWGASLVLWGAVAARAVPTVVYVRSRLRLDRGKGERRAPTLLLHLAALVAIAGLVAVRRLPILALLPFLVLLVRAWLGLSPGRRPATPQQVGIADVLYGGLTVLAIAVGFHL